MTDLTPVSSFDNVVQLETNTLALGGTGNPMNQQAQALLNRTEYLNDERISHSDQIASLQQFDSDLALPDGSDNVGYLLRNVSQKLGDIVSVADHASADAAALAAYTAGRPLLLLPGETAKLVCNPTSGDDIQAMSGWLGSCLKSQGAALYIELADGVHTVNTYIDVYGVGGPGLDIRATASPDFVQITGVAFSPVSGIIYEANVTVSTPLPSGAVVGGPIGMQNIQGTIDTGVINGCQTIKSIAIDRLSFTFDFFAPVGAPTMGVLDNTLTDGLVANQAVVFKGSLICLNTGWDGASREGFMNALDGGRIELRNIGLAYSGAGGTEHDMLFARGAGSRIYLFDRVGVSGAGDKILRSYGGAEIFANRSYLGGAAKALEIFQGVAGGTNQIVRTSCGGASSAGFTAGHASKINFAQGKIGGIGIAFRTTTEDAAIACYPATISACSTAMLATQGTIAGTSATVIKRCTLGVDWAASGIVVGAFTLGAGGDANTSDSVRPGNTWYRGGIWYQNTALNGEYESITIRSSVPAISLIDSATTALVSGDGGNLTLGSHSNSRDVFFKAGAADIGQIDGTDGHHYAQAMRLGVNVINTARPFWTVVTGTPEGVVTAPVGSMVTRTDGGAGTTLYVKETGAGNTGWVAK